MVSAGILYVSFGSLYLTEGKLSFKGCLSVQKRYNGGAYHPTLFLA